MSTELRIEAAKERFQNKLERTYQHALTLANELDTVRSNYQQGRVHEYHAIQDVLSAIGNGTSVLLQDASTLVTENEMLHELDKQQMEEQS